MAKSMGIIGRKLGMTRVYNEHGRSIPVTVIQAGPCTVLQKKTVEKEGYNAIQVGFMEKKESRSNKPELGHCKRSGAGPFYHIREFRVIDPDSYEIGQLITVSDVIKIGDNIDISGRTKGRGYQGVIKRHGFGGGRATHGSNFHRAPGSIGCSAWPSRVVKGRKLPGHMGTNKVSQKNMQVVDIREDENIVLIKGSVPGAKNGVLSIETRA